MRHVVFGCQQVWHKGQGEDVQHWSSLLSDGVDRPVRRTGAPIKKAIIVWWGVSETLHDSRTMWFIVIHMGWVKLQPETTSHTQLKRLLVKSPSMFFVTDIKPRFIKLGSQMKQFCIYLFPLTFFIFFQSQFNLPNVQSNQNSLIWPKNTNHRNSVGFPNEVHGTLRQQTAVKPPPEARSQITIPRSAPLSRSKPEFNWFLLGPFPILPPSFIEIYPVVFE